jgi:AraC family transcriptional regulator
MTRARTAALVRSLGAASSVPHAGDPWLLPAFTGLVRDSAMPDGEARTLACRGWIHAILALITRRADAAAVPVRRSAPVERAIALLSQRLDQPLSIAALSAQVGLGRSALHERFIAEVGLTPAELRMSLRLEEAKRLLSGGGSNAEIARRLGFASAQHFITAFRRAQRMTPGAWRSRGA